MPQSIQRALKDSPEWLIAFRSFPNCLYTSKYNIKYIDPIVVNTNDTQLSSLAFAKNISGWRL
jgi:hypothetical protein